LLIVCTIGNKRELVADLMLKAKQVEILIQSLPEPEAEEAQVIFERIISSIMSHLESRQRDYSLSKKR
jgi:hypothetical protein